MSIKWKDVTSRRRGEDSKAEPRTVEAQLAWARVCVTRHINNPGKWTLWAPDLGISSHRELAAESLDDAKKEALGHVALRVAQLAGALK